MYRRKRTLKGHVAHKDKCSTITADFFSETLKDMKVWNDITHESHKRKQMPTYAGIFTKRSFRIREIMTFNSKCKPKESSNPKLQKNLKECYEK